MLYTAKNSTPMENISEQLKIQQIHFKLTWHQHWLVSIPQRPEGVLQHPLVYFVKEAFCQHASCTDGYLLHEKEHLNTSCMLFQEAPLHWWPFELFYSGDS